MNNLLHHPYLDLPSSPISLFMCRMCDKIQFLSLAFSGVHHCPFICVSLFSETLCFSRAFQPKSRSMSQERGQICICRLSVLSCACYPGAQLGPHYCLSQSLYFFPSLRPPLAYFHFPKPRARNVPVAAPVTGFPEEAETTQGRVNRQRGVSRKRWQTWSIHQDPVPPRRFCALPLKQTQWSPERPLPSPQIGRAHV